MELKSKGMIAVLVLVVSLAIPVIMSSIATTASVDQDFYGWKLNDRSTWSGEWTKGNLGKNWKEGDWVSYVIVLNGYGGTSLPPIDVQYDFYISTKDGVFVDLLRNFYYMIRDPYPGSGTPNDITPLNYWLLMTPFTPEVINRPYPEGTPDNPANPPQFAFWRLTPNEAFKDPIPFGKTVVIYFEAHLAQSFIWMNGLENLYTAPPTDKWGGDRYAGWTATHGGAGYTSGSNPQFRLSGEGIGQKTVPIPIPPLAEGQICGVKYHDLDADGIKDPGEPGLEGWTINLEANIGGIPILWSATTKSDGSYCFTMLPEGTYIVSEVLKEGWTQSAPKPVPPGTHTVNLGEGASITGKDFGNYQPGSISGYKWNDINGNGVWDVNESVLPNWTIELYSGESLIASTLTNSEGYYEFTGLLPGSYIVSEVLQAGWTQTYPTTPGTHEVTITSGANIQNKNFGNTMPLVYCWETAYAYGGNYTHPFTEWGFSNWGWTNGPIGEGTYVWDIYAGAGQNDLSKGTKVGSVTIEYSGGTLHWKITLDSPYTLQNDEHKEEVHVYVGSQALPTLKKGRTTTWTVAPGQYPYTGSEGSVSGLTGQVYVIVHAIVGIPCEPVA